MEYIKNPLEIERLSMEIIEGRLHGFTFTELQKPVVKRVVHTTGDSTFAALIAFGEQAVDAGTAALLAGEPLFCDVEMARSGLSRIGLQTLGIEPACLIHDAAIAKGAKELGTTRAVAAMTHALNICPTGGIFVIGNAPTALFKLLEVVQAGQAKPSLIIGTPVGFVGAAESKELLTSFAIPWITIRGEKGGSTIAAAIVNALVRLALTQKEAAV
ncbi:MAG TPA: precorrin-8X methylmutase [Oscillospiraceae bacterium]|nr:precorrin-8X methylmutase [Oscillospiraceae bacterium]